MADILVYCHPADAPCDCGAITTTTNGGAVITSITGNGLNSSLNAHPDALSKLKAEVKSG
jgi:hypothetical protein